MRFQDLLDSARRNGETVEYDVPDSWKQGRTLYGGVTTALNLHAARMLTGETRALRSAMVNFVGPSTGKASITATPLRSGRNVSSVRAHMTSEGGAANEAVFTFANHRDVASITIPPPCAPDVPSPVKPGGFTPFSLPSPAFYAHFEIMQAHSDGPFASSGPHAEILLWMRHKDDASRTGEASLMAIADCPPPAIMARMTTYPPLSSITWMVNLLQDNPVTQDGWWLLRSTALTAGNGFSTQSMQIWNTQGEMVVSGQQMIAIF